MFRSYLVKSSGKIDVCTNKEYWNVRSPSNNGGSTLQRSDFTKKNLRNTFYYRNTKRFDAQKFVDDSSIAPWDTTLVFKDTGDIVDSWYKIFTDILDFHTPVKEKIVKKRAQPIWFTSDIISEAVKKRDKLLKKARTSESPADWATFKRTKNEVCILTV